MGTGARSWLERGSEAMAWLNAPMIINEATVDEGHALADVHARAFEAAWTGGEVEALLRQDGVFGVVARRAGPFSQRRPIGFILVRTAADEAEVLTVAVHPGYRRRGVARRLMEYALRSLYHDRIAALFLEVDAGNEAALALYRRLGFREVGKRLGYYRTEAGERSTALVMRCELR